jgi:hypothetical protein
MSGQQRIANRGPGIQRRQRLYDLQEGLCHWCQQPMVMHAKTKRERLRLCTRDHVYVTGDTRRYQYVPGHIAHVAACMRCNQKRGDLSYDEFLIIMRPEWRQA